MNICYISYVYPNPEDPALGNFIEEQLIELAKNHKVYLITRGKKEWDYPRDEVIEGVHINRIISKNSFIFNLKCFFKIIELNNKVSLDILNTHFVGYLTVISGLASKIIGKPFFVTAYGLGLDTNSASLFRKFIIILSYKFAKKIINISNYTKMLSEHYSPKEKQVVITPGITELKLKVAMDSKKFRKKLGLGSGVLVLSVGSLIPRKGYDISISVISDIVKKYPDLVYVIIGYGPEEHNLNKMVKDLNLMKNVIFVKFASNEELANYYNASDIFILMNKTEGEGVQGFGMVYVEANAMGKPVIAGSGGGIHDAIIDGKTGFVVDPENKDLIKEKLLLLIEDKSLRKKMGDYGKRYALKTHLWKYKISQLVELYSKFA